MDDRPVLVTGAAGCVGAYVVQELLDSGASVRATDRPGAQVPEELRSALEAGGRSLEWVEADLTDPSVFAGLARGTRGVIHTAAWVDISVPFEVQAPINLHAVRRLYEAARDAGAEMFVHLSTGSLYAPQDRPLVETDPLMPTSGYELAKLLAEDYLRAARGPRVNMLRPALIYGPRGRVLVAPLATIPELLRPLDGWIPKLEGGPRSNLVHAQDVARAAVHLFVHPQPHGSVFNVACPDVKDLGEYMEIIMRDAGVELAPLRLPFPGTAVRVLLPFLLYERPVRWVNSLARLLWRRTVQKRGLTGDLAPRADREAIPYLTGDTIFSSEALQATGFEFKYPTFEEGWRQTLEWYRRHRWLPDAAGPEQARARAA